MRKFNSIQREKWLRVVLALVSPLAEDFDVGFYVKVRAYMKAEREYLAICQKKERTKEELEEARRVYQEKWLDAIGRGENPNAAHLTLEGILLIADRVVCEESFGQEGLE